MVWKDLDATRVIEQHIGFVLVKSRASLEPVPLFCAICQQPNLTPDDVFTHREHGCCASCALRWVDVYRKEWLAGWRPNAEDIQREVKRRRARPVKLPF